ncbi:GNAT family N-acetyltransferase [Catenuloplanes atrovinosus]|uniref:GNAT family N-acetyltransferase n=1 Tax=Catenuloplanes atrovinosus TaxID=137266 RepID=UPI00286CEB09|nr:GNAT family protein [Catenuloplanes atrovinosus]
MFDVPLGSGDAVLRPLEPWQSGDLLANIDRGREFIGRFIGLADAVTSPETAKTFLMGYAEKAAADTGRIWGIHAGGALVGGVLFRTMDVRNGTAEAGCWLEPSATGRGLITRAVTVIIDWAIRDRGIHRVEWQVSSGNTASIAVATRLGMTRDGVLRSAYAHHGERHDIEIWSVLAPEWTGPPPFGRHTS